MYVCVCACVCVWCVCAQAYQQDSACAMDWVAFRKLTCCAFIDLHQRFLALQVELRALLCPCNRVQWQYTVTVTARHGHAHGQSLAGAPVVLRPCVHRQYQAERHKLMLVWCLPVQACYHAMRSRKDVPQLLLVRAFALPM